MKGPPIFRVVIKYLIILKLFLNIMPCELLHKLCPIVGDFFGFVFNWLII